MAWVLVGRPVANRNLPIFQPSSAPRLGVSDRLIVGGNRMRRSPVVSIAAKEFVSSNPRGVAP